LLYIKANIITTDVRYRKMIIGHSGQKIKEIGKEARAELELALNKKIYLELEVKIDPKWVEKI